MTKKEWVLEVDQELRIEVAKTNEAKITVRKSSSSYVSAPLSVRQDTYTISFIDQAVTDETFLKEVRYNCSAHSSAHLFVTAISSHSHIRWKHPQITFLQ